MPGTRDSARWRFLITPKWLGWHVFVIVGVLAMLWLGDWQLHRAAAGNSLSWAYTFEWPLFAIFAVVFWVRTIRDEVAPAPRAGQPGPRDLPDGRATAGTSRVADAADLASDDAYLARLTAEVMGHGRWHGLR